MSLQVRGLKEEVKRVLEEVLKAMDFDMDTLVEADPGEVQALIFNAVLSVIDEDEIPFIEWITAMVEKEEVEGLKDESGEFIVN